LSDWGAANSTRLNIAKMRVVSYSRKSYKYQLCHAPITSTSSIKNLDVFFDSKLCSHDHVYIIFSACIKLLGFIRSLTFRLSSLDYLYVV
jgi:hypothetical protein